MSKRKSVKERVGASLASDQIWKLELELQEAQARLSTALAQIVELTNQLADMTNAHTGALAEIQKLIGAMQGTAEDAARLRNALADYLVEMNAAVKKLMDSAR